MTAGPRETAYDNLINPLMSQIIEIAKEHGIPMLATFELDLEEGHVIERDQTTETIIDTLLGDFVDDPQRSHQIAELGVEKDSLQARVIDRLTEMLSWNLVHDAGDMGFELFERVRRPGGAEAWKNKNTGRSRTRAPVPIGSVLLVPRRAEEKIAEERLEAKRAARGVTARKAPKSATRSRRSVARARTAPSVPTAGRGPSPSSRSPVRSDS